MSFYSMLFGRNAQADLLLAVIGLRPCDVERFRDVHASEDGAAIVILSRTGGGNRDDYPNLAMRKRSEWAGSTDDDFDSTYARDRFNVPSEWRDDVAHLSDVLAHGIRHEFAQHLAKTLLREPTDSDKAAAEYERERAALSKVRHVMANGHTFVPYDDAAMRTALTIAELNGGKLRTAWGIAPLTLEVRRDFIPYPNAAHERTRTSMTRVQIDYQWTIDEAYWQHCQEVFTSEFPVSMGKVAEDVERLREKARAGLPR